MEPIQIFKNAINSFGWVVSPREAQPCAREQRCFPVKKLITQANIQIKHRFPLRILGKVVVLGMEKTPSHLGKTIVVISF